MVIAAIAAFFAWRQLRGGAARTKNTIKDGDNNIQTGGTGQAENSISDGDGNTQIGHNSGTITVGLTFEQHEAAMECAIARKEADLERVHTAEKALIQRERDADYQARITELAEAKARRRPCA